MAHSNIFQTTPLSCIGPRLYNWEDDRKFIQWLKIHPTSSEDEIISVNFIDGFATWQNNEVEVDLATLLDDINFKDVFGIKFNGIQIHKLDDLIEESNFILPL